jgi:hypothetical protein
MTTARPEVALECPIPALFSRPRECQMLNQETSRRQVADLKRVRPTRAGAN